MLTVLLLACGPQSTTQYAGTKMSDYFAYDGKRRLTYNNEDTTIDWQLIVEKEEQTTIADGREIITFDYSNGNTGELFGTVQYSSVASDSVFLHGYSSGPTGELITFETPVPLTDDDDAMRTGDTVETDAKDSTGASWHIASTYVEPVPECPSTAQDNFTQCVHMNVDDGDGDPLTGPLFTGDFTLVASYGAVYQTISGWATEWELTDIEYEPE